MDISAAQNEKEFVWGSPDQRAVFASKHTFGVFACGKHNDTVQSYCTCSFPHPMMHFVVAFFNVYAKDTQRRLHTLREEISTHRAGPISIVFYTVSVADS